MSGSLYMPLWTDAYLGDTKHLSTVQHGAYLLILMAMWRNNGALPNDEKRLARTAGLTIGRWRSIMPEVMDLLVVEDGVVTQKRLQLELQKSHDISRKRIVAGQAGADAKRLKLQGMHSAIGHRLQNDCSDFADPLVEPPSPSPSPDPDPDPDPDPSLVSKKQRKEAVVGGPIEVGSMPWLEPETGEAPVASGAKRPSPTAADLGSASPDHPYAFEQGVIRLTPKDFAIWKSAYSNLNLERELLGAADWVERKWGQKWFNPLKGWLTKRDQEVERDRATIRINAQAHANAPVPARRRPGI